MLKKITKPMCISKDDIKWHFSFDGGCELVSAYVELLQKPGQNCAGCWCLLTCFNTQ